MWNVVRKLHAKFHPASFIRKCFKIGATQSLTKKQKKWKILFMERFWDLKNVLLANGSYRIYTSPPMVPPKSFLDLFRENWGVDRCRCCLMSMYTNIYLEHLYVYKRILGSFECILTYLVGHVHAYCILTHLRRNMCMHTDTHGLWICNHLWTFDH